MLRFTCLATAAALSASNARATTINVPADQPTIQAGIDAATDGDTVLVAPGVYHERFSVGFQQIEVRSSGGAGVTTIDGDGGGTVVTVGVFGSVTLRGFRIVGGMAENGGGVTAAFGAHPAIFDCVFSGNTAVSGGAIYAFNSVYAQNCAFIGNTAVGYGGAIMVEFEPMAQAPAQASGCTFQGNSAGAAGGAIYSATRQTFLEDCAFTGNSAVEGGAVVAPGREVAVRRCTFRQNTASGVGGALVFGRSFTIDASAPGDTDGPGPTTLAVSLEMERCSFVRNEAAFAGGLELVCGSSAAGLRLARAVVRNCVFEGNHASADAAAIRVHEVFAGLPLPSTFVIGACTITQNSADNAVGGVQHVGFTGAALRVYGCVLWQNSDATGFTEGAQFYTESGGGSVEHSCVQDLSALIGLGNIGLNPQFVDPLGPDGLPGTGDENLRLKANSPCLDAGDARAVTTETTIDFAGLARVIDIPAAANLGLPVCGFGWIDMGAYERQGAIGAGCLGDENEDGLVDFLDLNDVLSGYGHACPTP